MQSSVRTLVLIAGISSPFNASAHNEDILEACPALKEGSVKTATIQSDFALKSQEWGAISHISGEITAETVDAFRNDHLFADSNISAPTKESATESETASTNEATYSKPSLILLNTIGGSMHAAMGVIDTMNITQNITTLCSNNASSSALAILASGQNRYANESCVGIAHFGEETHSGNDRNTIYEVRQFAKQLDTRYKASLINTHLNNKCYDELIGNGDVYLNSGDLLKLGIVDAIITGRTMIVREDDYRIKLQACTAPIMEAYKDLKEQDAQGAQELEKAYNACYDQHAPNNGL